MGGCGPVGHGVPLSLNAIIFPMMKAMIRWVHEERQGNFKGKFNFIGVGLKGVIGGYQSNHRGDVK